MSDFPPEIRSAVEHRSQGNCEAALPSCWGQATHLHHRKLRRHGDNSEANALHLCVACHTLVHNLGDISYQAGLLVHSWDDPAEVPITWPVT